MTTALAQERDTDGVAEEIAPEFIVDLTLGGAYGRGIIKISAQRSFTTRQDINRWLQASVTELAVRLAELDDID